MDLVVHVPGSGPTIESGDATVQVSIDLRCSRISWMLILYVDLIHCCLLEVALRVMIRCNFRCLKVIE